MEAGSQEFLLSRPSSALFPNSYIQKSKSFLIHISGKVKVFWFISGKGKVFLFISGKEKVVFWFVHLEQWKFSHLYIRKSESLEWEPEASVKGFCWVDHSPVFFPNLYIRKSTAHISRPRCPRRQCKIFQLRGIFSYWICVILCTLCYFTHSV